MVNKPFSLVCIILITIMLTMPLTRTDLTYSTYYSNSFDSPSSLNDGYWEANDTQIQTINGTKVLEINGEASFNPQHGNYSLDNFTIQFDVYHNVLYENNTAYSGPFYQAADSENRTILLMGYIQRETSNGDQVEIQQEGFLTDLLTYHHYHFPFNRSSEWSTWRLTGYVAQVDGIEGFYRANFTIQVDNETINSFRSDSILPEGTVHNITNEEVRPIAYHNIYPLPQTGVMIIPTTSTNNDIKYSLLSNKVTPAQSIQAIPSYIDNFLYGYADAVPMSQTSPSTPTPTPPIPTSQEGEDNVESTPTPTSTPNPIQEFPYALVLIIVIALAVIIVAVFKFKPKNLLDSYRVTLMKDKST
jgi:hypothetical protein